MLELTHPIDIDTESELHMAQNTKSRKDGTVQNHSPQPREFWGQV